MRINDPAIKSKKFLILLLLFSGIAVTVPHGSPKSMTVIGIDLGTTYSRVAVFRKGDVDIIPNDLGNRVTPSWVAFTDSETLVGEAAKNQATMNAERTIFDVNRLIGRKFDDPEVQRDIKFLPYKVVNKGGKPYIQVKVKGESKVFSPEEISAMILGKMKETAEAYLGKKIEDAVITVPAYFDEAQRRATDDAGEIAGLNVAQIIDEPTAAAIACCHGERSEKNILVYDLGGGTFDASVVKIFNFASQVLATSGDTHLGGEDFDLRLMDYFIKLFKKKYNKDIRKDKKALGKLRRECERAKRALSDQQQVQVKIESLFDGIDFSEPLTRERFEELNMDLFRKTLGPVKKALEDAGLERICVDEIVLVGGSTRIPKVQQLLKDMFDGKEPKMDVNPDEAVAYGAAFKGGIVSSVEWLRAFPLILVNPSSLGVETVGGIMTKLIPRKVMLPIKKSQVFTTYQDRQTTVSIKVFEGGRNLTKDCRELVRFDLSDIPPAPRGVPQIEVTFELKGVLRVTAVDKATKKSQSVTVIPDDGITSEWIEKRFKEAEEMDEEDERVKEMIDARNELEPYIYSIGSSINDKDMLTGKRDSDDEEMTEKTMKEALQ